MVVGYSDSSTNGPTRAFVYTQSGGMQDLGTLGGAQSYAYDINNSGQIVGIAQTVSGAYDGFISSGNGPMIDLGTYTPLCINDAGQVVAANNPAGSVQTYISSGGTGTWVDVGSLGGDTHPYGMNNSGEIVGSSAISTSASYPSHAFLYSGGTMADLGTLGGQSSFATGVNDYGVVIGASYLPGDVYGHAFVYYGSGAIEDLNSLVDPSLGWTIEVADAINGSGQIAAEAYQENGEYHAILLTPEPTPEPSSVCLLLVAAFAFLGMKARRLPWGKTTRGLISWIVRAIKEIRSNQILFRALSLKRLRASLVALSLLCTIASRAYGGTIQYSITDLGVLGSGPESFPVAMNDDGEVVGYADTYTHYSHAFLYNGSASLINLGSFGGDNSLSIAQAINNQGMVVGYSDSSGAGNDTRGFLYTGNGPMQDLGSLGGPDTQALDINNSGQIVGVSQLLNGTYDGFLYSGNGPMVNLGPYKAILINDAGQMVATTGAAGSGYHHTFISSGGTGTWLDIGSLGGTETQPQGMNNRGDIVGSSTTSASSELSQAFVYRAGISPTSARSVGIRAVQTP